MTSFARPLLVGCLGARDPAGAVADACALPAAVDLLEVRLDRFDTLDTHALPALVRDLGRPAIATLRSVAEGGEFAGDLAARLAILAQAEQAGFAWIDLEAGDAAALARGRARRIVAWHGIDTAADPTIAGARVQALAALDADVVKVAATLQDPWSALRFVGDATAAGARLGVPVAAIAMGAAGRYLRPLAGKFGMPLLYAAAHPSRRTAAGQLTVREAIELFRVAGIRPATRVFAVAGGDVTRSLSPMAHNHAMAALDSDAVYVSIDAEDFGDVMRVARELPLHGVSVTSPHKAAALALADEADALAVAIGAANTLLRDDAGRLLATNTDAAGFAAGLDVAVADPQAMRELTVGHAFDALLRLDGQHALDGRKPVRTALVFGTGGAARAIAYALRARGVAVTVTGRDPAAATAMVLALGAGLTAVSPERASSLSFDLLVKAIPDTPDDDLPLDPFDFQPAGFAADVVYRPLDTNFLLASRRRGRTPIPGLTMFSEQAVLQAARFLTVSADAIRPHIVSGIVDALR